MAKLSANSSGGVPGGISKEYLGKLPGASGLLEVAILRGGKQLPGAGGPLLRVMAAALIGVWLGQWPIPLLGWLLISLVAVILCFVRQHPFWVLLAVVSLFASWAGVRHRYMPADDIRQYMQDEAQLLEVTGTIISPVYMTSSHRGAMGKFSYRPPSTLFVLKVDHLGAGSASGKLLVKLDLADARLVRGDRVRCLGWAQRIGLPGNPGEINYRQTLEREGIGGRITLPHGGNLEQLAHSGSLAWFIRLRGWCARLARQSLDLGIEPHTPRLGLLQTMLLGHRPSNLAELDDAFRRVGLAHLLSISGAHLGILLWLTWMVAKLFFSYPPRAATCVLIVLGLYLLVVPTRVPIARAGIMATVFCLAQITGRRTQPLDVLAIACLIVLAWRPSDLFTPGFMLSFGTVGGLVLFVQPVSHWLWPDPTVVLLKQTRHHLARRMADYLAVNVVAFSISLPLVIFHYKMIAPWNIILTLLALPGVTLMLALGYLKMVMGFVFPSVGLLLAGPTGWTSDVLRLLVEHAVNWPGATIGLGAGPSVAWTLGALGLVIAILCGFFAGRRQSLAFCLILCLGWGWFSMLAQSDKPPIRLRSLAVSNGSCFLLEYEDQVLMFDCGSQQYLDVGKRSVVPALQNLNIHRIDTLILSHADMDHFGGTLDLIKHIEVRRVLISPQMFAEGREILGGPVDFLLKGLEQAKVPIQVVSRGWTEPFGQTQLKMLWPPADWQSSRANDSSLVLSIRHKGRRILLNGDIQEQATQAIMKLEPDLRADICDLPHHGSIIPSSRSWLEAVQPAVVLQSCGKSRLYHDRWPDLLKGLNLTRLVTARQGMLEVEITQDDTILWRTFK